MFMMCDCRSARTVCERYIRPRNRWMIAMADNLIDIERIKKSCKLSNTLEWFDSLCAMDAHRNIDAKRRLSKFQKIAHNRSREEKNHIKIKIKTKKNDSFFSLLKFSVSLNEFMDWCALSLSISPRVWICLCFVLLLIMKIRLSYAIYSQL